MTELVLAGSGAGRAVWLDVLTGITGLAASYRRSGQAASAGAAGLAAKAVGLDWDVDRADPVAHRVEPDDARTERYRRLRPPGRRRWPGGLVDLDAAPIGEGSCG